jgi:hypothetical protein
VVSNLSIVVGEGTEQESMAKAWVSIVVHFIVALPACRGENFASS